MLALSIGGRRAATDDGHCGLLGHRRATYNATVAPRDERWHATEGVDGGQQASVNWTSIVDARPGLTAVSFITDQFD